MSKKKELLGKTKLKPGVLGTSTPLNIIKHKEKTLPTSFRLKESDKLRLKEIVKDVNEVSPSYISETAIIRALIHIGLKIKKEKIIDSYKELL